jgi:hypothetical protein
VIEPSPAGVPGADAATDIPQIADPDSDATPDDD